jgi:hypothetical protein
MPEGSFAWTKEQVPAVARVVNATWNAATPKEKLEWDLALWHYKISIV